MKNDIAALFAAFEDFPADWLKEENCAGEFWEHFSNSIGQDVSPPADVMTMWRLPGLGHYVTTPEESALYLLLRGFREEAQPNDIPVCWDVPSSPAGIFKHGPYGSSPD